MNPEMEAQAVVLTDAYGYKMLHAIIVGIAGLSPRTVMPNLTELLTNIVSKRRDQAKSWLYEILFKVRFYCSRHLLPLPISGQNELPGGKAGNEEKKKLLDAVVACVLLPEFARPCAELLIDQDLPAKQEMQSNSSP
jgi:hypothetical protein